VPVIVPDQETSTESGWTTVSENDLASAPKDPAPAGRSRRVPTVTTARGRVTASDKRDIKAKIAMMLLPGASLWGSVDPFCGTAFAKVVPDLSEDLADILADNAEIVAWFASGAGWLKYLKLLSTLQPVAVMVYQHHIAHTVGEVKDDATSEPNHARQWESYTVPGQAARTVTRADSLNR
jgi:hypothetical protein